MTEENDEAPLIDPNVYALKKEYSKKIREVEKLLSSAHRLVANTPQLAKDKEALEEIISRTEALQDQLDKAQKDLETFDDSLLESNKSIKDNTDNVANLLTELREALVEIEESRNTAVDAVGAITSSALVGAYDKEAKERNEDAKKYYSRLVWALVAMSILACVFIFDGSFKITSSQDLYDVIPRMLLFVPISLIALVTNKQLNINQQMREEYSHKASLSQSFEGYRRLIESDPKEFTEFFRKTVEELCKNPAEKIEKMENEIDMLAKVAKLASKAPELFKGTLDSVVSKIGNNNTKVLDIASYGRGERVTNGRRSTDLDDSEETAAKA